MATRQPNPAPWVLSATAGQRLGTFPALAAAASACCSCSKQAFALRCFSKHILVLSRKCQSHPCHVHGMEMLFHVLWCAAVTVYMVNLYIHTVKHTVHCDEAYLTSSALWLSCMPFEHDGQREQGSHAAPDVHTSNASFLTAIFRQHCLCSGSRSDSQQFQRPAE